MAAASELFAAHGFHGTKMRDIAAQAGVNLASANYHFGSKESLYLEVLRAQFGEVTGELERRGATPAAEELRNASRRRLVEVLEQRVAAMLDLLLGPPVGLHGTLMQREMCDPSEALPVIVSQFISPQKEMMERILARLFPRLDGEQIERCVCSIVGQVFFYRTHLPAMRLLLDRRRTGVVGPGRSPRTSPSSRSAAWNVWRRAANAGGRRGGRHEERDRLREETPGPAAMRHRSGRMERCRHVPDARRRLRHGPQLRPAGRRGRLERRATAGGDPSSGGRLRGGAARPPSDRRPARRSTWRKPCAWRRAATGASPRRAGSSTSRGSRCSTRAGGCCRAPPPPGATPGTRTRRRPASTCLPASSPAGTQPEVRVRDDRGGRSQRHAHPAARSVRRAAPHPGRGAGGLPRRGSAPVGDAPGAGRRGHPLLLRGARGAAPARGHRADGRPAPRAARQRAAALRQRAPDQEPAAGRAGRPARFGAAPDAGRPRDRSRPLGPQRDPRSRHRRADAGGRRARSAAASRHRRGAARRARRQSGPHGRLRGAAAPAGHPDRAAPQPPAALLRRRGGRLLELGHPAAAGHRLGLRRLHLGPRHRYPARGADRRRRGGRATQTASAPTACCARSSRPCARRSERRRSG